MERHSEKDLVSEERHMWIVERLRVGLRSTVHKQR